MPASREAIMEALFALLTGTGAWVTKSRRLVDPEGLGPTGSPALFLMTHDGDYKRDVIAAPPKREIHAVALMYNDVGPGNPNAIPETPINNALDALDALLKGDNPLVKKNTLGGLVEACFIEGTIAYASGDITGKASTTVPIKIILP